MFNGICSKSLKPLYLQIREEKLQIISQLRFQYDRRTGSQKKMEKEKKKQKYQPKTQFIFKRSTITDNVRPLRRTFCFKSTLINTE